MVKKSMASKIINVNPVVFNFIGDYVLTYKGCFITLMLIRGFGICDIALIKGISINKALKLYTIT
jgi:hypothetical protein